VKTQPFDQTYRYINQLRTSIVLITMFFILLALILAVTVSRGIYRPVGNLVRQISGRKGFSEEPAGTSRPKDEISYLSHVYEQSMERLNTFQSEKGNNRNILRTYLLRKLLVDSHATTQEELERFAAEYGMTIDFSGKFAVCVIRMGNCEAVNFISASDMALYQFAIINISMEVFAKYYGNEGIDIREDHVVILINPTDSPDAFLLKMKEVMREAQGHILKHFQLPVSMTISEVGDRFDDITRLYNAALGNAMYSYVGGKMSIILPSDYAENELNTHMSFSAILERKLSEGIKAGNPEQIESVFKRILDEIAKLRYKNMMLSVMHLVNIISDAVEETNKARVEPVYIDYNMFQKILDISTLQELYEGSMEIFRQIISRSDSVENRKHVFLVDAIKEIIGANYQNPGLCLQQVADTVKMSQVYVGKIFKSITQLSVAEYLNEVRLAKASELLCNGKHSINEIVHHVGMENESYFYKLFKARFGVTPREYCLNKAVSKQ
jgi:AraC-like DNA-binding protein